MSRPGRVLLWMLSFLGLLGLAVVTLIEPLSEAFYSNPVFNAIIVGVFAVGVLVSFRQVASLSAEVGWVKRVRSRRKRGASQPRLLASLDKMFSDNGDAPVSLSPLSLRAVLDSVRLRLDESRDVSRYTIGLLIFLGLLGTFWGLLDTVSAVGSMISDLNAGGGENGVLFGSLLAGLDKPLAGMGTAFSSSLFGLAGSLVLGFLDLQVGHAQNRFFNELEDWLTGMTRMSGLQMHAEGQLSDPTYIHAMLEQTAETLDKLQRSMMRDDAQRRQVSEQIQGLGEKLAVFVDQSHDEQRLMAMLSKGQAELAPVVSRLVEQQNESETSLQTHVRNLDVNIKRLADNLTGGREQLSDEIRDELRLIARALSAEAHGRNRHQGQKSRAG
jgi:hypothetical protein